MDDTDVMDVIMAEPEPEPEIEPEPETDTDTETETESERYSPIATDRKQRQDRQKLEFLCRVSHSRTQEPQYRGSYVDFGKCLQFPYKCLNGMVVTLTPPDQQPPPRFRNRRDKTIDSYSGKPMYLQVKSKHRHRSKSTLVIREPETEAQDESEDSSKFQTVARMYSDPIWLGTYPLKHNTIESWPYPFDFESQCTYLDAWHRRPDPDSDRWLNEDIEELYTTMRKPICIVYAQVKAWCQDLDQPQLEYYSQGIPEDVRKERGGLARWRPRYLRRRIGRRYKEEEVLRKIADGISNDNKKDGDGDDNGEDEGEGEVSRGFKLDVLFMF